MRDDEPRGEAGTGGAGIGDDAVGTGGADETAATESPAAEAPPTELRDTLDIPEWVSEIRRLYVEPKTQVVEEEGTARHRRTSLVRLGRRARNAPERPAAPAAPSSATEVAAPFEPTPGPSRGLAALAGFEDEPAAVTHTPSRDVAEPEAAETSVDLSVDEEQVAGRLTAYLDASAAARMHDVVPVRAADPVGTDPDLGSPTGWTAAEPVGSSADEADSVEDVDVTTEAVAPESAVASEVPVDELVVADEGTDADADELVVSDEVTDADADEPVVTDEVAAPDTVDVPAQSGSVEDTLDAVHAEAGPGPIADPAAVDVDAVADETNVEPDVTTAEGLDEAPTLQEDTEDADVARAAAALRRAPVTAAADDTRTPEPETEDTRTPEPETEDADLARAAAALRRHEVADLEEAWRRPAVGRESAADDTGPVEDEEGAPVADGELSDVVEDGDAATLDAAGLDLVVTEDDEDPEDAVDAAGLDAPARALDAEDSEAEVVATAAGVDEVTADDEAPAASEDEEAAAGVDEATADDAVAEEPAALDPEPGEDAAVTPGPADDEEPAAPQDEQAAAGVDEATADEAHAAETAPDDADDPPVAALLDDDDDDLEYHPPPVHLSWRQADSLDFDVPAVDDPTNDILIEAPSQLVAPARRRHDPAARVHREQTAETEPVVLTEVDSTTDLLATRASMRAAAREGASHTGRWVAVAAVALVVVVAAVWLIMRGVGSGAAAAPARDGAVVASAVVAATTSGSPQR